MKEHRIVLSSSKSKRISFEAIKAGEVGLSDLDNLCWNEFPWCQIGHLLGEI